MKKASGLAVLMAASIMLAGCGPKPDESTPSANPAPVDSSSQFASPEVMAEIKTDGYGIMFYAVDKYNRIGVDLNGFTKSGDFTEEIDRNLTGQIKESIRDSRLKDLQKLPADQQRCNSDSYNFGIIVPSLGSSEEYKLCEYPVGVSDPLFEVAEIILGEYAQM